MSRWLAPLVFALALGTALGAGAQDAPADDADNPFPEGPESDGLTYDAIDRATVRIFAVQHVEVDNVPGQRFARVIASPVAGHGSGIVVRRDGLVVTAKHVIEGARHLAVRVPGEDTPRAATVVYADETFDFALLMVDGTFQHTVPLPETESPLRVRQTVHAIGYPLDPTRRHPQSARGIIAGVLEDGGLQLDMSLNPGNSGGPLVDENGALVGIVIARGDVSRGVQGIGLAVPIGPIIAWAKVAEQQGNVARGRQRLAERRALYSAAAEVVTLLVEVGGADVLRELMRVIDRSGGDETLRRLHSYATGHDDPYIEVLVAALYWDAAQIAMEVAGSFRQPQLMPPGDQRDRAVWFHEQSIRLVQAAVGSRPQLRQESPFVRHVLGIRGNAPIVDNGAPLVLREEVREPHQFRPPFWRLELALVAGADQPAGVGGGHLGATLSWSLVGTDERAPFRVSLLLGPTVALGIWEGDPLVFAGAELGVGFRYAARGAGAFAEIAYSPGLLVADGRLTPAYAAYRVRLGFSWWRTITGIAWLGLGRSDDYAYHALTIFSGRRF